jgi:acyl dehydratase
MPRDPAALSSPTKDFTMAVVIEGVEGFKKLAGQHLGKSRWIAIDQDRINKFADVTEDWNWIHIDPEKAKASPFGSTIAHGFMTLAMIIPMVNDIYELRDIGMGLNYGFNKVRIPAAVPVDSKIRLDLTLKEVQSVGDGVQLFWDCIVECDAVAKPAVVAEWIVRFYPSPSAKLS